MRPRTATIQVAQSEDNNLWIVQIGNTGASTPIANETGQNLGLTLIKAVLFWQKVEGLGV